MKLFFLLISLVPGATGGIVGAGGILELAQEQDTGGANDGGIVGAGGILELAQEAPANDNNAGPFNFAMSFDCPEMADDNNNDACSGAPVSPLKCGDAKSCPYETGCHARAAGFDPYLDCCPDATFTASECLELDLESGPVECGWSEQMCPYANFCQAKAAGYNTDQCTAGGMFGLLSFEFLDQRYNVTIFPGVTVDASKAVELCPEQWAAALQCTLLECPDALSSCPTLLDKLDGSSNSSTDDSPPFTTTCNDLSNEICDALGPIDEGCCLGPCVQAITDLSTCVVEATVGQALDCTISSCPLLNATTVDTDQEGETPISTVAPTDEKVAHTQTATPTQAATTDSDDPTTVDPASANTDSPTASLTTTGNTINPSESNEAATVAATTANPTASPTMAETTDAPVPESQYNGPPLITLDTTFDTSFLPSGFGFGFGDFEISDVDAQCGHEWQRFIQCVIADCSQFYDDCPGTIGRDNDGDATTTWARSSSSSSQPTCADLQNDMCQVMAGDSCCLYECAGLMQDVTACVQLLLAGNNLMSCGGVQCSVDEGGDNPGVPLTRSGNVQSMEAKDNQEKPEANIHHSEPSTEDLLGVLSAANAARDQYYCSVLATALVLALSMR